MDRKRAQVEDLAQNEVQNEFLTLSTPNCNVFIKGITATPDGLFMVGYTDVDCLEEVKEYLDHEVEDVGISVTSNRIDMDESEINQYIDLLNNKFPMVGISKEQVKQVLEKWHMFAGLYYLSMYERVGDELPIYVIVGQPKYFAVILASLLAGKSVNIEVTDGSSTFRGRIKWVGMPDTLYAGIVYLAFLMQCKTRYDK